MYNAFDQRTLAAAAARFDARLRHRIAMDNGSPNNHYPCPRVGHNVHVQRGGPSPVHAPSPLPWTLDLTKRANPTTRAARRARRVARRRSRPT